MMGDNTQNMMGNDSLWLTIPPLTFFPYSD